MVTTLTEASHNMSFDSAVIRRDFPLLAKQIDGKPLVYLDSANTSQKPNAVIDAMANFMRESYAPINRSAYTLAANATEQYEGARAAVAKFINAKSAREIVFTKNATEALNLIVSSWGRANLKTGDVVLLTHMEHHANIVPWQMLQQERGIELRWVPLTSDFQLDLTSLTSLLSGVKVFSFTSMSNVLGTINPVENFAQRHMLLALFQLLMRASRCHTRRPMFSRGARTLQLFLVTKCVGRRVLVFCGVAKSCSKRCHRFWVAAT